MKAAWSGGDPLIIALMITVAVMSAVLFFYVNIKLLFAKKKTPRAALRDDAVTLQEYAELIKQNLSVVTFEDSLGYIVKQIARLEKKREFIDTILRGKFSETELSYGRFQSTIDSVEKVMGLNIKSILNRIHAFDEEEYLEIKKGKSRLPPAIVDEKLRIYNEYIEFVRHAVEDNDEILLRLDKLLSEISKFNSLSEGELEQMGALQEMDALINDTKWYK